MQPLNTDSFTPQVKICGLTSVKEAQACAQLGAAAVGCVFYPKSPRHLSIQRAAEICAALPPEVKTVGVFVNESFSAIMAKVERCRLSAVQLHGRESPELVKRLRRENLIVIKALFTTSLPELADAPRYEASAFLAECGGGALPGGTARAWDWRKALPLADTGPVILAGGLSPLNVVQAVEACLPAGVDVSSGVEKAPGRKDLGKVKSFIEAVSRCTYILKTKRIF
jgi:phosphoribosylanthranilate isomerase